MDIWIPWLIVAVSVFLHFVATLVLIAYPARTLTFAAAPAEATNGHADPEPIKQIDNRARVVFIGLQAASLIAGAFAVSAALLESSNGTTALVVGGLIAFGGRFVIHGISSFTAHRYRVQTRRLTLPIVWLIVHLTTLPGTIWLTSKITGRTPGDVVAGLEASEALKESLDLLEV